MGKHSVSGGDPFSGFVGIEEKTPADKIMDRLFRRHENNEYALAKLMIRGRTVEGVVNSVDRSGANMVSIGFKIQNSISVDWRGRRFETKVEPDHRNPSNAFELCDGGDILEITFVPKDADRCPMNGDLWDPSDPDDAA